MFKLFKRKKKRKRYTFTKEDRERAQERKEFNARIKRAEAKLRLRKLDLKNYELDLEEARISSEIEEYEEDSKEQEPLPLVDLNDEDSMVDSLIERGLEAYMNNAKETPLSARSTQPIRQTGESTSQLKEATGSDSELFE